MEYQYFIRREAFLNVISKFDLSTLKEELQEELLAVAESLNGEINKDVIEFLDRTVEKYEPLKKLYDTERQALREQGSKVELRKGIPPRDDNPKPQDLASTNHNPPTIEEDKTNLHNTQTQKKNK